MPRKGRQSAPRPECHRRFNEAGAVMPRKRRPRAHRHARRRGFNEAGAVMPRKAVQAHRDLSDAYASMRPGLLCPGRARTYRSPTPSPMTLQ